MRMFNKQYVDTSTARIIAIVVFLAFFTTPVHLEAKSENNTGSATKGYNCLFMGHSFFAPIAKKLADHPMRCGFPKHKQTIAFSGGKSGSPGKLWKSKRHDVMKARKLLETGTVDLLGLTFYPNVGSSITDYRKWVDLALKYNPKTRFIIQAPWAMYHNKTLEQYEADAEKHLKQIHRLIDQLRKAYPKTTFLCIPQGRWMVGLWRLYEKGKLPEVTVIKRANRSDKTSCLFMDELGHGGPLPVKTGALLWLAIIYNVDLNEYQWSTNTEYDLKQLVREIVQNDPYCGFGPRAKSPKTK